jgi:tryptophan halogenase
MKICIIGTGVAGLLSCNFLASNSLVEEVVLIGSPNIPSIGVGESTTLSMNALMNKCGIDLNEFVRETDASVKYGVYYENWSRRDYIHYFKSPLPWFREGIDPDAYSRMLANKDPDVYIHDLIGENLFKEIKKNNVLLDTEEYWLSWHFEASKGVEFLLKKSLDNKKVTFISGNVIGCEFIEDYIDYVILEDNRKIKVDYYINTSGKWDFNTKIFKEEYESLSDILLTNKAVFSPIEYTVKRNQFHPYTVAKTMRYGWRWITPTYSRIGSGYVFSDKYISDDEAVDEFLKDIGDQNISPHIVDFSPRYNKKTFRRNSCSIGMSNGFLEPLDAPGVSIMSTILHEFEFILRIFSQKNFNAYDQKIDILNKYIESTFNWWCSFILCQYKTCHRNDTNFWNDHKNVNFDYYNDLIANLDNPHSSIKESMMFAQSFAAKDIKWKTTLSNKPFKILEVKCKTLNHLDWINTIRNF